MGTSRNTWVNLAALVPVAAAFAGCGGGGSGSSNLPTVGSLEIMPTNDSLAAGRTRQFTLTAHYSDGTSRDVTLEAEWTSNAPAIASIESGPVNGGKALGLSVGDAVVRGKFEVLEVDADLHVTPPEVTEVAIQPSAARLPLLVESPLIAIGTFTDASLRDVTALCSWVSSDLQVAEVGASGSEAGVVRTLTTGTTLVTASLQGHDGTASIEVVPVDALELAVPTSAARSTTQVAFGPAGQLEATWCYQFAIPGQLYLSHFEPASAWGSPELYDTSSIAERVFKSDVVTNDSGAGLLTWDGHDGLYAAYREPGGSFSSPAVLESGVHPFLDFAPWFAPRIDSAGRGLVVWKTADFHSIQSARFLPASGWEAPDTVVPDAPTIGLSSTQFEMNDGGTGFLVWLSGSVVSGWQLLSARFDPAAGWQSFPAIVDLELPESFHLAVNPAGDAIVTWRQSLPTPLVFATLYVQPQGWLAPEVISASNDDRNPMAASASNGNAFVAWYNASDRHYEGNRFEAGVGWQGVELLRAVNMNEGDPTILTPFMNDAGDVVAFWATGQVPPIVQYRHYHPALGWEPLKSIDYPGISGPETSLLRLRTDTDGRSVLTWQEPAFGDVEHAFAHRFSVP